MILRSRTFRRITIVGVGMIGGSLGMAIKKNKLAREVVGLSYQQASLDAAIKNKAIDVGFTDVQKAIRNSDLVILATPVDSIIKLLSAINPYLKRGCVVTDVGSAKVEIMEAVEKKLKASNFFVGSHPLAGSEKIGSDNAREDLFENTLCVMTPKKETHRTARERVKYFWTKLGANVKCLKPEEHDEILSYISHLPHLMAYGLMETIPKNFIEYAAQGLKDTTRIAGSSPQMWNDICMSNSKYVLKSLDEMVKNLSHLRKAIVRHDQKTLMDHFTKAKEKRDIII